MLGWRARISSPELKKVLLSSRSYGCEEIHSTERHLDFIVHPNIAKATSGPSGSHREDFSRGRKAETVQCHDIPTNSNLEENATFGVFVLSTLRLGQGIRCINKMLHSCCNPEMRFYVRGRWPLTKAR
jgi:hypothetical protein